MSAFWDKLKRSKEDKESSDQEAGVGTLKGTEDEKARPVKYSEAGSAEQKFNRVKKGEIKGKSGDKGKQRVKKAEKKVYPVKSDKVGAKLFNREEKSGDKGNKPDVKEKKDPTSSRVLGTTKGKKSKKKKGFPKEQAVLIARTIIKPKVSEAAMNQQTLAKYVFYVKQNATKNEVAKAVQAMYGKEVRKVNIVNYSPQTRTFRGYKGTVKGYKKAIVSLEKGQTIDVFSE